jgi:uroporphyrinogen-III synthase
MSTDAGTSGGFAGLRVVVFEARMAEVLGDLVAKHGGVPVSAPALREIPIRENPEAQMFVRGLKQDDFDVVLFETGVGVRYLVEATETRFPLEDWPSLLARVSVIARGPKPASALRSLGVIVDFQVPEPNTWRETLTLIDERIRIAGLRVAVQEYGKPNQELLDGLSQRGAVVTRVPVYRWAMPTDTAPLRQAIQQIIAGEIGAVMFTAAQQVEHMLQLADHDGSETALRTILGQSVVVGSIGPTTSTALRNHGLPVDIEPEHPKSGHLVAAVAEGWRRCGKALPRDS